jgi:hypothetical protein
MLMVRVPKTNGNKSKNEIKKKYAERQNVKLL